MKNKMLVEHAKPEDALYSGLIGYLKLGTTYDEIVSKLGEPTIAETSGDGKVKAEWVIRVKSRPNEKGVLFTIYDYKSSCLPEDNTCWHIGGHHGEVVLPLLTLALGIEAQTGDEAFPRTFSKF